MVNEFIKKAVEKAGSQEALADYLGCSQSQVWKMLHCKAKVSPGYVLPLEKLMEGEIPRHQWRPDLYPQEATAA